VVSASDKGVKLMSLEGAPKGFWRKEKAEEVAALFSCLPEMKAEVIQVTD